MSSARRRERSRASESDSENQIAHRLGRRRLDRRVRAVSSEIQDNAHWTD